MKEILQEAMAKENIGEIGFFYLDKKRAMQIFKSEGTNYPTALNTHNSNVIIRDIGLKVNKKISNFTQSQQFIRWFGDWQNNPQKASKVVNAAPKIMYHGSPENFSIFDRKKSKPGSYERIAIFAILFCFVILHRIRLLCPRNSLLKFRGRQEREVQLKMQT